MEEKKLTDEEIVKALDCCAVGRKCGECPYFIKKIDCLLGQRIESDLLDLIHRLQSELSKELAEHEEFTKKANAEIERLTEENEYLDGCAKQFFADYKKCEVELSEKEDKCLDCPYQLKFNEIEKQAVKNTAKEILAMFDDRNYISEKELKNAIKERYGVGVEE